MFNRLNEHRSVQPERNTPRLTSRLLDFVRTTTSGLLNSQGKSPSESRFPPFIDLSNTYNRGDRMWITLANGGEIRTHLSERRGSMSLNDRADIHYIVGEGDKLRPRKDGGIDFVSQRGVRFKVMRHGILPN